MTGQDMLRSYFVNVIIITKLLRSLKPEYHALVHAIETNLYLDLFGLKKCIMKGNNQRDQ